MALVDRGTMADSLDLLCQVIYAASVLAANSVLRSLFGFAFPLFVSEMFKYAFQACLAKQS